MAEQISNGELRSEIRRKLNQMAAQINTARRDWFTGFDGPRCFYNGKSWDLAVNGNSSETPGTGSAWNDVTLYNDSSPGAFTTPTGTQITEANTFFEWTYASNKTPQDYRLELFDDGVSLGAGSGSGDATRAPFIGIPLDGSTITVDIRLRYTDSTEENFSRTFTSIGGVATWTSPIAGSQVNSTTVAAQWSFGTRTPQSWTLTATNTSTSTVINTYSGTTSSNQTIAGLPNDGSDVAVSLTITFTDTTVQTLSTNFTNGVAVTGPQVTITGGATISGEMVVAGDVATWNSSAANQVGNAQTNFATGGGPVEISSSGTVTELRFRNAGLTTFLAPQSVQPTHIDLRSNPQMAIPVGNLDWTAATYLDIRDAGSGTILRDQDIPQPGNMTYFDICSAAGVTVSGTVMGQMVNAERICNQGTGIGMTDAHFSAQAYAVKVFLVGYNQNVTLTTATLAKMPNLTEFQCPSSNVPVVDTMFSGKPSLTSIDVTGGQIATVGAMDAVLTAIRNNAQSNGINGGTLRILTGNPTPTSGGSNADIVYLQSTLGWSVT